MFTQSPIKEFKDLLMQKRVPRKKEYEYTRELKKQPQGIQDMISAGEKPGYGVIKPLTVKKKKPKVSAKKKQAKKKKKPTLLQKTKKRLKKTFGGY